VLPRRVIIAIPGVGRGLGELYRLLGGSWVGVGGLIRTGVIVWVFVLAAHDGVRLRVGGEVSSVDIEVRPLSVYAIWALLG
jgi:hypothetical protein